MLLETPACGGVRPLPCLSVNGGNVMPSPLSSSSHQAKGWQWSRGLIKYSAVGGFLLQQDQFRVNWLTQRDSVDCSTPYQALNLTIKRNNCLLGFSWDSNYRNSLLSDTGAAETCLCDQSRMCQSVQQSLQEVLSAQCHVLVFPRA